ncbi:uncharacterized protein itprid1 [Synchiropus splendidus]|uniref:uncharacterized protein itprid1 n=1 Tax=Synchiropus splendidus TaxID=270530 RepID=UPI00237E00E2|nr:uncharacterized protein itprid1 [Synchiropus splendidus]
MDMSNLWNDDPEELLLDLGFGCDEPDLSGRIPARFINYQSQAKGINLQVFLDAQKTRVDLENPDVSNRFRQVEVLQQVSTAFSSLRGSSCPADNVPPEARERKRRIVALFRQASKRAKSQIRDKESDPLTVESKARPGVQLPNTQKTMDQSALLMNPADKNQGLTPLVEEDELDPQPDDIQGRKPQSESLWDGQQKTGGASLKRGRRLAQESFEIEEIQSFDEGGISWVSSGAADHIMRRMKRNSSCRSDSSGFLEEPFIPTLSQQPTPGADLIKALSGLSGGSTEGQSSDAPASRSQNSSVPPSASYSVSVPEEIFHPPESPSVVRSPLLVFSCHTKSDFSRSDLDSSLSPPPAPLSPASFPHPSSFISAKAPNSSDVFGLKPSHRSTAAVTDQSSLRKDLLPPASDITLQKKPDHFFCPSSGETTPHKGDSPSYGSSTLDAGDGGDKDSRVMNSDLKIMLSGSERKSDDATFGRKNASSETPSFDPNPPSQVSQSAWSPELIGTMSPHTDENLEDEVFHSLTGGGVSWTRQSEVVDESCAFEKEPCLQHTNATDSSVKPGPGEDVSTLCQENLHFDGLEVPGEQPHLTDPHAERRSEQTRVSQLNHADPDLELDASHLLIKHTEGGRNPNSDVKSVTHLDEKERYSINSQEDKSVVVLERAKGTDEGKALPKQKDHSAPQLRPKRPAETTHTSISHIEEAHKIHLGEEDFSSTSDASPGDHLSEVGAESGMQTFREVNKSYIQKTAKTSKGTTEDSQRHSIALQEHHAFEPPASFSQRCPTVVTGKPLPATSCDESSGPEKAHMDNLVQDVSARIDSVGESFSSQRPQGNAGKPSQDFYSTDEKETLGEHLENPPKILKNQGKSESPPTSAASQGPHQGFKRSEPPISSPQSRLLDPPHVSICQYDHSPPEDLVIQRDFHSSINPSVMENSFSQSQKSDERSERDAVLQVFDRSSDGLSRTFGSCNTTDLNVSPEEAGLDKQGSESPVNKGDGSPRQIEGLPKTSSQNTKYDHMDYLVQVEFHTTIDESFMDGSYQGGHESQVGDEEDVDVVKCNFTVANKAEYLDNLKGVHQEKVEKMVLDKPNSPASNGEPRRVGRPESSAPQKTSPVTELSSAGVIRNIPENLPSTIHQTISEHSQDDTSDYLRQDAPHVRKADTSQETSAEAQTDVQGSAEDKRRDDGSSAKLISEEIYYETAHSIDEPGQERDQGDRGSSVLGLIEIETLDQVFETSVDGSEAEYGDADFYFQQLDTERRVYWAEPIMVSNLSSLSGRSDSEENTGGDVGFFSTDEPTSTQDASLDTSSSTESPCSPHFTSIDPKPGHHTSVQMPSSSSSHIVHRKDVPFVTDSKHRLPPLPLPLDTSTPFRAVQSWTDLRIQQTFPSGQLYSTPSMYRVPLKNVRGDYQTASYSVDRLCLDEEDRSGGVGEKYWEAHGAGRPEHQCNCCVRTGIKGHGGPAVASYSLDELEEMILCLQQFRSVLTNMEEQLAEDQAAVYKGLTEQDRQTISEIEALRQAVKKEARELEAQLNDLVLDYDDTLKLKMHRLLHEQSRLCSQLRVAPPRDTLTSGHGKTLDDPGSVAQELTE